MTEIRYSDLDCTVLDDVPGWAPAQVDRLYESLYATVDYAQLFDEVTPDGTLVIGDMAQVALFARRDHEAWILTRTAAFTPTAVNAFCTALFRTFRRVRCVRVEVLFDPAQVVRPCRNLICGEDYVLDLPGSVQEYRSSLGKTTRRHLNGYFNKLRKERPDLQWRVVPGAELSPRALHAVIEYNKARLRSKGIVSSFERRPEDEARVLELIRRRGIAGLWCTDTTCPAAGIFCVEIQRSMWAYTMSHDPALDRLHLGLLCMAQMVATAIERGDTAFHMGWTTPVYKQRLGAQRIQANTLVVYRDHACACRDITRATSIAWERAKKSLCWWRLTHAPQIAARSVHSLTTSFHDRSGDG